MIRKVGPKMFPSEFMEEKRPLTHHVKVTLKFIRESVKHLMELQQTPLKERTYTKDVDSSNKLK